MEKTLTPKSSVSTRPRRQPIASPSRLGVRSKDPNYEYRIVNTIVDGQQTDRVELLQERGWEIVPDAKVGSKRVDNPSSVGSVSTISVGKNTHAVVMRIKKEWYDEDQRSKQENVEQIERQMSQDAKKASDYGALDIVTNKS